MISVQLIKVGVHMPWDSETPEWLRWVRSAVRAAGDANQHWSHEFCSVWTSYFEFVLKWQFLGQVVRKHQLRVCQRRMEQVSTTKVAMMQGPRPPQMVGFLACSGLMRARSAQHWPRCFVCLESLS